MDVERRDAGRWNVWMFFVGTISEWRVSFMTKHHLDDHNDLNLTNDKNTCWQAVN